MAKSKARHFAFLIYRDSAPADYEVKLEAIGQPIAMSPWHDRDKWERMTDKQIEKEAENRAKRQYAKLDNPIDKAVKIAEGKAYWLSVVRMEQANQPEYKKEHRHCIYIANNPVTTDSVRNKLKRALGDQAVSHVEIVDNIQGAYLYLTHESKDAIAKGKHVYDAKDIVLLNNFDLSRYVELDADQKMDLYVRLVELVEAENIMNMKQLMHLVEQRGEEIGITNLRDLIKITSINISFLKCVFDGNYQSARHRRWGDQDE